MRNSWGRTQEGYARHSVRSYGNEIHCWNYGAKRTVCGKRTTPTMDEWELSLWPIHTTCRKCLRALGILRHGGYG
jgi:hypothetical protein